MSSPISARPAAPRRLLYTSEPAAQLQCEPHDPKHRRSRVRRPVSRAHVCGCPAGEDCWLLARGRGTHLPLAVRRAGTTRIGSATRTAATTAWSLSVAAASRSSGRGWGPRTASRRCRSGPPSTFASRDQLSRGRAWADARRRFHPLLTAAAGAGRWGGRDPGSVDVESAVSRMFVIGPHGLIGSGSSRWFEGDHPIRVTRVDVRGHTLAVGRFEQV